MPIDLTFGDKICAFQIKRDHNHIKDKKMPVTVTKQAACVCYEPEKINFKSKEFIESREKFLLKDRNDELYKEYMRTKIISPIKGFTWSNTCAC